MMKRIVSILLALLLLGSFVFAVSAEESYESRLDKVLNYYKTELKDETTPSVWTLYALLAAEKQEDPEFAFMVPSLKNLDVSALDESALATTILSAILLGEPETATAAAEALLAKQLPDGGFGKGGAASCDDTTWAIGALHLAQSLELTEADAFDTDQAVAALAALAHEDGGYNNYGTTGSVDSTGMAILALSMSKSDAAKTAVTKAVAFLASTLDDGANLVGKGEWDSANSCSQAYGIIGLLAAGEDVTGEAWSKGGKSVVDVLLSYQDENGGFWYDAASRDGTGYYTKPDAFSTYQGMLALSDLANEGSLWLALSELINPSEDVLPTTPSTEASSNPTTESTTASAGDSEPNPSTGQQKLNPVFVVIIIVAVLVIVGILVYPMIQKKKK